MPTSTFTHNENSQLNQYWYSQHTIETLVKEIQLHGTKVAFLSTPSLYFSLTDEKVLEEAVLFEFDTDFSAKIDQKFEGNAKNKTRFVHYDFNEPEKVPVQFMGHFDYVVVDPPFITEEVWKKYAATVKLILNTGSGPDAAVNGGSGKVLFTSVLENHNMLESVNDLPLYIANFMPSIPHLVYQYYVFVNYPPTSINLSTRNTDEVPFGATEEDKKVLKAIAMANDLRESEIAFTHQMRNRDRNNEVPLPAPKARVYVASDGSVKDNIKSCDTQYNHLKNKKLPGGSENINELMDRPIEEMRWNYVPEGLTEYANGASGPAPESTEGEFFGEAHANAVAARTLLENFKKTVDSMQKHLDVIVKCELKIATLTSSDEIKVVEAEGKEANKARKELLATMAEMKARAEQLGEDRLVLDVMQQCIDAYTTIVISKQAAQELAADATRKFKSPIFNRQKVLLADIKKYKQEYLASKK